MATFKHCFLCGAFIAIASMPAFGGGSSGGATEVTQLLNNVQLIQQYTQQLIDYEVQWEAYLKDVQQQLPIDARGFYEDTIQIRDYFIQAAQIVNRGQQLYGSLEELENLAEKRYSEFASSGLTWEDYIERSAKMTENYRLSGEIMTEHEVHVMQTVQDNYAKLSEVMADIPYSVGSHQSMQMLNSQMSILNGSMNEMLSFNASMSRRETERNMLNDAKKESEELARIRETTLMGTGRKVDEKLKTILDGFQSPAPSADTSGVSQ